MASSAHSISIESKDWFVITNYLANEYSFKARAGNLRIQANLSSKNITFIDTPAFITFTRSGLPAYLSPELAIPKNVEATDPSEALKLSALPLSSCFSSINAISECEAGFAGFLDRRGHSSQAFYACLNESTVPTDALRIGPLFTDRKSVSIFLDEGRKRVTCDEYVRAMSAIRPFAFQTPCDLGLQYSGGTGGESAGAKESSKQQSAASAASATNEKPPAPAPDADDWEASAAEVLTARERTASKRARKAVDRSLEFLHRTIALRAESPVLQNSKLIGSIVGSPYAPEAIFCARQVAASDVDGFAIDCFSFNEIGCPLQPVVSIPNWRLLDAVLNILPAHKVRIVHSVHHPLDVLQAVLHGCDLFVCSYPAQLAEVHRALVFDYRAVEGSQSPGAGAEPLTLDLTDSQWASDLRPLLEGCECYACAERFSRAYLAHLSNTRELLARMLLVMHNTHHYERFMNEVRRVVRAGRQSLISYYDTLTTRLSSSMH